MSRQDKPIWQRFRGTAAATIAFDEYETVIFWSDKDDCYVADVPELPGCTVHGDSYEEALAHAKEAIALRLDTASEAGDPIPQPRGHRLLYA